MLRNWKLFGVTTLMVFALNVPASAGDKDGPPQDDKFTKLEKQIDAFKTEMAKEFANLGTYVNGIKDEVKNLKEDIKNLKADTKTKFELAAAILDERLAQMRLDIDRMKNGGTKSYYPPDTKDLVAELRAEIAQLKQVIAKYPPNNIPQPIVTTAAVGEMMVVNRYPEEIQLLVNGADQGRIAPSSSRVIQALPAGAFTYEIISPTWGSSGVRRSTIVPGDPLRVNVQ